MSYVVLLETSGNQAYLFATNKLKENIGASELTCRVGTQWVLEAVQDQGGPDLLADDPGELRGNLKASAKQGGIEVVVATSGKALLVVDERQTAETLVAAVTCRALKEAPGMDIAGAIVDYEPEKHALHGRIREVHRRLNSLRAQRPLPASRFPNLPVVAPCASSGLPAEKIRKDPERIRRDFSRTVLSKRETASAWLTRLWSILKRHECEGDAEVGVPSDLDKMEQEFPGLDWIAVVHADGNGMGKTFLGFDEHCHCTLPKDNQSYLKSLRRFSVELDEATETAFVHACATLRPKAGKKRSEHKRDLVPIVPLILGGDDLTVLAEGRHALAFTKAFLRAFEEETAKRDTLSAIAKNAIGACRFGAGAGVAIVKPHFPFHSAYDLSESLLHSAKTVKEHLGSHGSALDFHILFDAAFSGLPEIRKQRLKVGNAYLTAGPYVVSPQDDTTTQWARDHDVQELLKRVRAIEDVDPETLRRRLPNSQLHALRDSLFQGREIADSRFNELFHRYEGQGIEALCETSEPRTLFRKREDAGDKEKTFETLFLDALSSASFWKGEDNDAAKIGARA
ncbi:MAG: Cas10/Cmr2 second palm domain-containing protein [Gammaproteobacteria bacterium]